MAHFYGTLQGQRGEATRLGTESSGMTVKAASWAGAIKTTLFVKDGKDCYRVEQVRHHNAGVDQVLAEGVIGERK